MAASTLRPITPDLDAAGSTYRPLLDALRAAAEPTRLRLLGILAQCELTVTEITQVLGQSQPRVSRHLRLLCDAGLLDRVPEGSWVFYRLADAVIARTFVEMLGSDDPVLASDRERLAAVQQARQDAADSYFEEHAHEWNDIRSLHVAEEEVERELLRLVGKDAVGDLLDIGTGTGRVLSLLAPRAARAIGIDRSHEMLAFARAALASPEFRHVQLRHGDMYHLALSARSVDVVVLHQVLHFADDPVAVMRQVARVLRPGGRLLLADFAPHREEWLREQHAHRRLGFSTDDIGHWAAAAGLRAREAARLHGSPLTVVIWECVLPQQPASA
ncbi:MAG TPA: metalloregulator ArsR/SmtB family transcription factor [Gemmatimonadaceae bacterium]|nr:metalloregulator ArsR/SmtB family transcription factor [Gemmatimonadaceae bacterium]